MLSVIQPNSQELHHSSLCDFSHINQWLIYQFYLMKHLIETRVRIHLTISGNTSRNPVAGLVVTGGDLHALLRDE